MKLLQTVILPLVVIVAGLKQSYGHGVILPGKVFISPDRTHSFTIEDYDREYHFVIKDLDTGKTSLFEDEFNPIFAVRWATDSKSVFIVAHYARGKLLDMVHKDGEKWTLSEVTPPEDRAYESEIVNWIFRTDSVHLIFKVMVYSKTSPEFYRCNFDFNPSTSLRSGYEKSLISADTYEHIKSSLAPK